MIISDETSYPILIDNIDVPTIPDYFWVLDLNMMDFTLAPLTMFEEQTTPTLEFLINDYLIEAPTNWNIMVYSEDTAQIDVAQISDLTRSNFTALIYLHKQCKIVPGKVRVIDYHRESYIQTPSLNKHTMLCHHAGPDGWVCLAPTDNYTKYFKDATIGDLL